MPIVVNKGAPELVDKVDAGEVSVSAAAVVATLPLTDLNLRDNQLTSIDLSNQTQLIYLNLHDNQLTSIDFSNQSLLTFLDLWDTPLDRATIDYIEDVLIPSGVIVVY